MGFKARKACTCNTTVNGTGVLDSRPSGIARRRRRKCSKCGRRFTTYELELPENTDLLVRTDTSGVHVARARIVNMPVLIEGT